MGLTMLNKHGVHDHNDLDGDDCDDADKHNNNDRLFTNNDYFIYDQ